MAKISLAVCAAIVIATWTCAASAFGVDAGQPVPSDDVARERGALQAIVAAVKMADADTPADAAALKTIIADPTFAALTDAERHAAILLYGGVLYDQGQYADAQVQLKLATAMPLAGELDWELRFDAAYMLGDYGDAAMVMTVILRQWPGKLVHYSDQSIDILGREVLKNPAWTDQAFALLSALYAVKWKPADPFSNADGLWLSLARLRLERGDIHGAKDVAENLHDPVSLLQMHADKRFDALVRADPEHYDVLRAYRAELTDLEAKAAAAPHKLGGINAVAERLLTLDRAPEAMALVSDALARVAADPNAFGDTKDKINWTHDIQSRALFALGRGDEALAALTRGAALQEDGMVNVSQAINLADEYVAYDRPKDALAAVASLEFSHASPYGRMALQDARACAYFELGDTAQLAPVLDYMKAHAADGTQPYLNTMLYIGNLDAVAAQLIAELGDPAQRAQALYSLQDYLPQPHPTARERAVHAAWIAARSRPDVAAAIARAGRIQSYAVMVPVY
ncbi:MAG TPA: hypothetical protein VHZ78_05025 [Rhizomicrobium sp.]|jgi:hypothetical protein|nr:hypothetical protein [Rhizomicrobium sp.]